MLWTRRREPRGRHRAVAAPAPPVPAGPIPAQQTPAQQTPAQQTPASTAPVPAPPLPGGSGVHLGFSDGSALELASGDPRIGAFRAVARTLRG